MRTPLLIVAPVVLLAACSSGSGTKQSLDATATPTTASASTAPATKAPAAPNTPASTAATSTTGGTTSTGTSGSTSTTTTGSTASQPPLSTKAPGVTATSKATPAGTYTYASSGKVTVGATPQDASGSQTLTISALKNGIQHSTLHSDDSGDTEEDIVVRDAGSYGASLKLSSPAFSKEFRPATPLLIMPDPAVIGKAWSWSATSTDGKTHVTATNKILRKESLTIGGQKVDTAVLQTHLVLKGDVNYDAQLTVWYATAYRLPVKNHSVGQGNFGGIPFKTDITAVMKSVKPA